MKLGGGTGAPPPKPTPSRDPRQRGSLRARCCSRARRQTMETPGAQERPLPNPPRHAIRDNAGRFGRGAAHARDDRLWKHRGHRSAPSQTHPVTRSATTRVASRAVLLTRETTDYGNTGGTGAPPPKPTPSRDPRQRGSLCAWCCSRARRVVMQRPRPLNNSYVERDGAQAHRAIAHVAQPDGRHAPRQLLGPDEPRDRLGKIRVRLAIPGHERPDGRDDTMEIESEERRPHRRRGLDDVTGHDPAACARDSPHLAEPAPQILQIPKQEG